MIKNITYNNTCSIFFYPLGIFYILGFGFYVTRYFHIILILLYYYYFIWYCIKYSNSTRLCYIYNINCNIFNRISLLSLFFKTLKCGSKYSHWWCHKYFIHNRQMKYLTYFLSVSYRSSYFEIIFFNTE